MMPLAIVYASCAGHIDRAKATNGKFNGGGRTISLQPPGRIAFGNNCSMIPAAGPLADLDPCFDRDAGYKGVQRRRIWNGNVTRTIKRKCLLHFTRRKTHTIDQRSVVVAPDVIGVAFPRPPTYQT